MRRPEMTAMAAAIAFVAIAIPLALHVVRPPELAPPAPQTIAQPPLASTGARVDRDGLGGAPAPRDPGRVALLEGKARADAKREAEQRMRLAEQPRPALPTPPPAAAPPAHPGFVLPTPSRLGAGDRVAHADLPGAAPEQARDRYAGAPTNPVRSVATEPVSTFSIDVDTASYAIARRFINAGRLPPRDSVRVEEVINYFPYAWPAPETAQTPFRPTVTVLPAPWNAANKLVHIAIKGYSLKSAERPRANLVFLVDVSGSMAPADRLPLLKNAFRMLLDELKADDTVAIVTYASGSDIRLKPTKVADKFTILQAIESLSAGGSTHGAAGIQDAYRVAEASFDKAAVNRVILATDGDWNVGITDEGELKRFIEEKRATGIYLSVLGVGMGNHNDALMQALAQNGNGVAAYIDTLSEARKVLVEESSSTLFPIAKDVKIQIEFNPARVAEYRLIGYETRALRREDFNNDKVDAGDIGSGHSVTAIYEITPVGAPGVADGLRYGREAAAPQAKASTSASDGEYAFLKLRYKRPGEDTSRLIEVPVGAPQEHRELASVPADVRFSVAAAAYGQLLRDVPYLKSFGWDDVIALANASKGDDPYGYRAEMIALARLAKSARR